MSSGDHIPPWTARYPWPPLPGRGALVSVFGAAWQGCPLPASLEHTPAPRSSTPPSLPHPPTPSFWGTRMCHIITATNDTKVLVPSASRLALGLSPSAAAPDHICHTEASLLPLLSAHLCPVLPRALPLAPCPTAPQADTPPSAGHHLCLWPRLQQKKPMAVMK